MYDINRKDYEDSRKRVSQFEALKRLSINRDFIILIKEGYLSDLPKRLVDEISATQVGSKEESNLHADLRAVSSFKKYLESLESSIHNDYSTIAYYETNPSSEN